MVPIYYLFILDDTNLSENHEMSRKRDRFGVALGPIHIHFHCRLWVNISLKYILYRKKNPLRVTNADMIGFWNHIKILQGVHLFAGR